MTDSLTDNEILALAEKIKRKREICEIIQNSREALYNLERDIKNDDKKFRFQATVKFHTITPRGHQSSVTIAVPLELANDLLNDMQTFLEGAPQCLT